MSGQEHQLSKQGSVDITELAVLGEQFPLRLMHLGYRLMQVIDETGRDQGQYLLPPVCEVPAGPFLMGSDRQQDLLNERPQSELVLPAFQIGKYLVTVAEYAYAVQAGAVKAPGTYERVTWQDQQRYPDHPIAHIPWRQAQEYSKWLAEVTGQPWRLSTEAEWEKAARGTDGRMYPWGDGWDAQRAASTVQAIMPVGCHPQGASPYGVQDMVGYIHQFTSSRYLPYPYRFEMSEAGRDGVEGWVLRGGHHDATPVYGRRVYRQEHDLSDLSRYIGVRLALHVSA
jgi:formylglycine-generating enzyme required for sulfatase activity